MLAVGAGGVGLSGRPGLGPRRRRDTRAGRPGAGEARGRGRARRRRRRAPGGAEEGRRLRAAARPLPGPLLGPRPRTRPPPASASTTRSTASVSRPPPRRSTPPTPGSACASTRSVPTAGWWPSPSTSGTPPTRPPSASGSNCGAATTSRWSPTSPPATGPNPTGTVAPTTSARRITPDGRWLLCDPRAPRPPRPCARAHPARAAARRRRDGHGSRRGPADAAVRGRLRRARRRPRHRRRAGHARCSGCRTPTAASRADRVRALHRPASCARTARAVRAARRRGHPAASPCASTPRAADQDPHRAAGPPGATDAPGTLSGSSTTGRGRHHGAGWLALPDGRVGRQPAPLLLWIHGGPLGRWNAWSWRWNPWLLVAQGYAVLLPDPALSTGYGQEFIRRGWGHWGGRRTPT